MNISIFYRSTAAISLNGSIAALIPAGLIVVGNLLFFGLPDIMLLALPFFVYSFVCFHLYLYRMRQSFSTEKNIIDRLENKGDSLSEARHLLIIPQPTQSPELHFFFQNGLFAGKIKRQHNFGLSRFWYGRAYTLFNEQGKEAGYFKVRDKNIEAYDQKNNYLGYFKKDKNKKQLFNKNGRPVCSIEGSNQFMDEKVIAQNRQQAARLRRGWMRVQWLALFPDPNTPVLSFSEALSEKDKLLTMSLLVQEFFIER